MPLERLLCFHARVFTKRVFAKYWLPVIAWMLLIFCGSGASLSSEQTSRFLRPIIHWLFPSLPEQTVNRIVATTRKGAHVTEYGVLALLVWRARRRPVQSEARLWVWRDASFAFAVAVAYAATDEFHQSLVPSRQGSGWDMLLDSCGAAGALLLLWVIGRWRKK